MAVLALAVPHVPAGMGFLTGALAGAITGTAQWVLRRRQFHWAGWWLLVSTLAWGTGLSLAPPSGLATLPRIVLSGVIPAVMTSITLELLLRYPKHVEERRTEPSG